MNRDISLQLIEENPGNGEILPFHYFDIMRGDVCVGKISLRFGDNFSSYYNGHVGFEVFPEYRGNNYAYRAMLLLLDIAKTHGINQIYLTCKKSNNASRRIFEKLNATFIEETPIPRECFFYRPGIEDHVVYSLTLPVHRCNVGG